MDPAVEVDGPVVSSDTVGAASTRVMLSADEIDKRSLEVDFDRVFSSIVIKKDHFVLSKSSDIFSDYDFDIKKPIGTGAFGRVYKAKELKTGKERAVKQIPKSNIVDREQFFREVESLKTLDHPNVIKLLEIYDIDDHIFLVQEFCGGGELFEKIFENGSLDEAQAANIFL